MKLKECRVYDRVKFLSGDWINKTALVIDKELECSRVKFSGRNSIETWVSDETEVRKL